MADKKLDDTQKPPKGSETAADVASAPLPGLALIFSEGQPILRVLPLVDGRSWCAKQGP